MIEIECYVQPKSSKSEREPEIDKITLIMMQTLIKTIDQLRLDGVLTLTRSLSQRINQDDKTGGTRRSFYDVLGVTSKATQGEIKAAYYKLSLTYHPDKNDDNEEAVRKFREITDAYDILGSYRSRRKYDQGILVDRTAASSDDDSFGRRDEGSSSRTARTRSSVVVGHTSAYNFDEWTRNHYGECLDRAFDAKQSREKKKEAKSNAKELYRFELMILSLLAGVFGLIFMTADRNYDTPKENLVEHTSDATSSSDVPSLD